MKEIYFLYGWSKDFKKFCDYSQSLGRVNNKPFKIEPLLNFEFEKDTKEILFALKR